MNYRHVFHAGNVCDVVKHAVLAALMVRLREKDAPFCVLDTHAGIGLYDLRDPQAQKTREAEDGILRLLPSLPFPGAEDYTAVLRYFNPDWQPENPASLDKFRFYPGSPFLARHLMRPQDRLMACEWHTEDAQTLKRHAGSLGNIQIHHRDGYEALGALLPPLEKRGLVVIDPPFEAPDEFDRLLEAAALIDARWAQGLVMIWYPVKERPTIWRFHEKLAAANIRRMLCAEFIYEEETRHDRLNGCGLILINPPWTFDAQLEALFSVLHENMRTSYRGIHINWLTKS